MTTYLDDVRKAVDDAISLMRPPLKLKNEPIRPEVELRIGTHEKMFDNVTISRGNGRERVFIESSTNSVRISVAMKQSDRIEFFLISRFSRIMGKQADNFIILRRKPVVGYDISFLATVDHVFNVESKIRRQTIVDFIIYFIREIDKEIKELKIALNARARAASEQFLKNFN
ncbi:ARP2/3 complex 20 kDa subunit (ARPC4) domain-containing protein [Ditylenchus destructor]|uniref:ARP2/3 complex 20 kDa subunit (ARPC4) domain-containing protein n=1 Tax=Ditylenchus destructor TaxID=166010 RepID=A0AAD4N6C7_9BILA|nr:ARP2/3 complex 20 kDa subunit (ARPC4) domain-containing protein [Ditylenchus destructor]